MGKKKYIKNSKGVTMSVTTDTLGLEKPLLNENYDIDVHNRNMDKIDEDLKPIDDSYIIELFQHDGDTSSPKDYYTKDESDEKFATKEEVENIDLSNLATKSDVENLKQSVSNGKQLIASAITDKEVPTSNTDSFQTMANNIRNIKTGIEVTLDGNPLDYDFELKHLGLKWGDSQLSTLPYNFYNGSAVIYNNEIHILGGTDGATKHYKFNGTSWISVSTLPYDLINGCAVVFNNEIHIMGGNGSPKGHYKFNGTSWISVSNIGLDFLNGSAVIYNNEIHIIGGTYTIRMHYKFNGTSWVSVSNTLSPIYGSSAVVCNNKIHVMGSGDGNNSRSHYIFDGSYWSALATRLPYDFSYSSSVAINNEVHIIGSSYSNNYKSHYKFNGSIWSIVETLPYDFYRGSAVVLNDEIYILGSAASNKTYTSKYMNVYALSKVSLTNN